MSDEDIKQISVVLDNILKDSDNKKDLDEAKKTLFVEERPTEVFLDSEGKTRWQKKHGMFMELLERIIGRSDENKYTVYLASLVYALPELKQRYKENGLSEEMFYETMADITYKVKECRDVFGVLGVEPVLWFAAYFSCERFALGRLQFERGLFKEDNYRDEIKKGDVVIKFHIPSSGPLTEDLIIDSFKRAYDFHKEDIKEGKLYFTCGSWLLYPKMSVIFPENSNLKKFYNLFDVVSEVEKPNNPDFWRVFNMNYEEGILEKAPRDNTLRRNLYEFMKKGNSMGEGYGVIVFDGEKIVNR